MNMRLLQLWNLMVLTILLLSENMAPTVAQEAMSSYGSTGDKISIDLGFSEWVDGLAIHTQPGARNVELVGQIGGIPHTVAIEGDYAYLGIGPRLMVLDISNPSVPTMLGQTDILPATTEDIAIAGDYAYLAVGDGGMRIINIADPLNPMEIGSYQTARDATSIAVAGEYAYVIEEPASRGTQRGKLCIINVADPVNPTLAGFYETETQGTTQGVAVKEHYAYVIHADDTNDDLFGRLLIVDIADPSNPTLVGTYKTVVWMWKPEDLAMEGDYAYVAGYYNMSIIDIADPANPTLVSTYNSLGTFNIAVAGKYVYIFEADDGDGGGVCVIDAADPTTPSEVGCYDIIWTYDVTVVEDYAYVAAPGGLHIVNITNPATPVRAGYYNTPGPESASSVVLAGDKHIYVATPSSLSPSYIISIIDLVQTSEIGFYDTPGNIRDVVVVRNYAYVADGPTGLLILDITDAANPIEISSYDTAGYASGVAVAGNYAYVADGRNLRIVDITNPANLTQISSYSTREDILDVAVSGDYAYVAEDDLPGGGWGDPGEPGGLRIINVADPANPYEVNFFPFRNTVCMALGGGYAYVAAGATLHAIDVADPAHPKEIGSYDAPGHIEDVRFTEYGVYVADGLTGLLILDTADRAFPREIGFYNTPGPAIGVEVAGNDIYVADGVGGLVHLRFTDVPPVGTTINGSTKGILQADLTFTAMVTPITTTTPITYVWQATGHSPLTHTAGLSDTATFSWDVAGAQAITVTATNKAGSATANHVIVIAEPITVEPDSGATLVYTDAQGLTTTIQVPLGGVTETTQLAYYPLAEIAAPAGLGSAGHTFDLNAYRNGNHLTDFFFERPVTITIHYSDADVENLDEEGSLILKWWNGTAGRWEDAACGPYERQLDENRLAAPICHLSRFALLGKARIVKSAVPIGPVEYGELLTYTLIISDTPGIQFNLYDPLISGLNWEGFVERPETVTYSDHTITGTLTISPTQPVTVSFVVRASIPETVGFHVDVTNQACVYSPGQTLDLCYWSNTVTNRAFHSYDIFLPLVLRTG